MVVRWTIPLLTALCFAQIWFSLGITLRLEDLVLLGAGGIFVYTTLLSKDWVLKTHPFKTALLLLSLAFVFSAFSTKMRGYPGGVVKDAILNAIRVVLALSSFFITTYLSQRLEDLPQKILKTIGITGLVALGVCLLQILYWDVSQSLPLPSFLTTMNEESNQTAGREVFGLYISDTSAHGWSAILAVAGFYFFARAKHETRKRLTYGLLTALCFVVLVRISVRASILGFIAGGLGTWLIESWNTVNKKRFALQLLLLGLALLPVYLYIINYDGTSYSILRVQDSIPSFKGGQVSIDRGSNIVGRLYFWLFAVDLFQKYPLTGSGFYSYEHLSASASLFPAQHAHNSYLNLLGEMGLLGFSAFAFFIQQQFKLLKKAYQVQVSEGPIPLFRSIATASLLFFLFTALFANPFYDPHQLMIRMILMGVLYHFLKQQKWEHA